MASDRVNSGSKGFDFGSDDILCSYDDFTNQDPPSNGSNSDPAISANKEFHKTRMARSSVFPTSSSYTPPEDSSSHDVNATLERTMKKYSDNMMRFLEGISSRLSQLELYCYNLDKTIGEMRSDLTRDNEEADVKLRSMDKHLQEVNRSVQVLRDKQELADTQKELARLQLVQKDSSSSSHGEERVVTPVPEAKKCENASDAQNNQLALALPHQIAPQPPLQPQPQHQQYYMPPTTQLQNTPPPAPAHAPPSQPQAPPAQAQFMPPPPAPSHPSSAQAQSFPQYQQNWPPQPQARLQSSGAYPTYSHAPPSNQSPVEQLPSSMQMQSPYAGPPQQSMQTYGYGAPPPQAPQQTKMSYNPQTGDGYLPAHIRILAGVIVGEKQAMESHGTGLRRVLLLSFCVAGIWAAYIYQGVLQETLSTKRFGEDEKRFEHLAFLNLAQNVVCLVWSFIMIKLWSNGGSGGAPWWTYWSAGITNTIGPAMGIEALKYISYPAQVLAKSSKMIPVMLMGSLVYGIRYTLPEYLCTFLVAGGVSMFALLKTSSKTISKLANPNAPLGYGLCFLNLAFDGFTNATQDSITARYPKTSAWDIMLGMNLWGTIYNMVYMFGLPHGSGFEAVQFCKQHPEAAWDILMYCLCGAVGQNFIFLTISRFGSLANTTITTTRKFVSIVVSSVLSGNPLSSKQWGCVSMVFGGLSYQIYLKWRKLQRTQKKKKT